MLLWITLFEFIEENTWKVIWSLVTIVIISAIYKFMSSFIQKRGSRLGLEPHVRNALRLLLRVVAIVAATTIIFGIWELPTNVFVGGSALIGAALGFGSSQTINNIVAGFYVLISQPFKVKDYVKIGDLEGQVEEISINYTVLYTPTFNILRVPNTQVLNSRILNITHEGYIKYTFTISFGHELTEELISTQIIGPGIEDFRDCCGYDELRTPEYYLDGVDRLEKKYLIRLFIPKGQARDLYVQQPDLIKQIMKHYDKVKAAS